ncbi:MAG: hypothetical protein Q9220_005370 [cf. Caloplaca sp. 1 TL-2023]
MSTAQPNPYALLEPQQENYLTGLAFHARGLTPWGLAMVLRQIHPNGSIFTGPDVCNFMHRLDLGGPVISHGFFRKWSELCIREMTPVCIEALRHMIRALEACLKMLPPKFTEVRIYNGTGQTIYQQMMQWNMLGPDADQRGFENEIYGITFGNKLRHDEEALDYRGTIEAIRNLQWVNRNDFLACIASTWHGATAYKLAQAVDNVFQRGAGVLTKDLHIYQNLWQYPRDYFDRFRHPVTDIEAANVRTYQNLFDLSCSELELNIDELLMYRVFQRDRNGYHERDIAALRHWDPIDTVNGRTILQQLDDRALRNFNQGSVRCRDGARYARPVAQNMVILPHLFHLIRTVCPTCGNRHGVSLCPNRPNRP